MTSETLGLQKVCDIHDFFRPEIDRILRKEIGSVPFGSRRAWEFAMIYRAIDQKGRLHGDAVGLGMGAGTEKLIYALAKRARKTVVTDLYTAAGGWEGVRTQDPKALVMSKAPSSVDPKRIDALTMDMRELKFPDESFDFCWSTGAIEHIGHDEDFARHLAEVHRVLRPGGVYAFTTAVVFGLPTLRIPHNYYFNPEHLVDLLHASPLHAEPEFDCRVTDHLFNRPHVERFQDYGFAAGNQISKPVVSFRRGTLLTANVMVLTKEPGRAKKRPKVTGYDASCRQLRRHADNLTKHLWKDYQLLQTELRGHELVVQPQYFGAAARSWTSFARRARRTSYTRRSRAAASMSSKIGAWISKCPCRPARRTRSPLRRPKGASTASASGRRSAGISTRSSSAPSMPVRALRRPIRSAHDERARAQGVVRSSASRDQLIGAGRTGSRLVREPLAAR